MSARSLDFSYNTATVILALRDEIRRSSESRYDHRLHGILLIAQGMSGGQVAQLLGDAPRTVAYWVRRFEQEGLAGLVDGERLGRPRRLNEAQVREIEVALRQTPRDFGLIGHVWDGKTLSAFIYQQWNVTVGVRQCQRIFRQLGFRLVSHGRRLHGPTPKCRPGLKKLQKLAGDPKIDLWSTDEVHFQQHGSRCRTWIPPEAKDPVLLHHPTRKSVGYFGAVRLRDGKFVFQREQGKFNGTAFSPSSSTCARSVATLDAVSL